MLGFFISGRENLIIEIADKILLICGSYLKLSSIMAFVVPTASPCDTSKSTNLSNFDL